MRFVRASERLPEVKNPPYLVIVRWWANGEHLRVSTMTPNQLADVVKWAKLERYEWLDESVPASIEQEAERLYPYTGSGSFGPIGVNVAIDMQRSAHITCARQYMGEIEKLKAEVEHWKDEFETAVLELREFKHKHNL